MKLMNADRWVVMPVALPNAGGTLYTVQRLRSHLQAMVPTLDEAIARQEANRLNRKDEQRRSANSRTPTLNRGTR